MEIKKVFREEIIEKFLKENLTKVFIGIGVIVMLVLIWIGCFVDFLVLKVLYFLGIGILIGSIIRLSYRSIPPGYKAMVVDPFRGRLSKYLDEGMKWVPFWQNLEDYSLFRQSLNFEIRDIQTAVGAAIKEITGVVIWRPDPRNLSLYFEVGEKTVREVLTVKIGNLLAGLIGTMGVDGVIHRYSQIINILTSELTDPPEVSLLIQAKFAFRQWREIKQEEKEIEARIKEKSGDLELRERLNEAKKELMQSERYKEEKFTQLKKFFRENLGVDLEVLEEKRKVDEAKKIKRIVDNIFLYWEDLLEIFEIKERKKELYRKMLENAWITEIEINERKNFLDELIALIGSHRGLKITIGEKGEKIINIKDLLPAPASSEVEEKYGIEILEVVCYPVALDSKTAQERAKTTWNRFRGKAADIDWGTTMRLARKTRREAPTISEEKALEAVLVNKGVIKKEEKVLEIPGIEKIGEIFVNDRSKRYYSKQKKGDR